MNTIFSELAATFRTLDPPLNPGFKPPATPHEIAAAEAALGMDFPADLRELLLCANGQQFPDPYSDPMFPGLFFRPGELGTTSPAWLLSAAEIVELTQAVRLEYQELKDDGPFEVFGPASYHDRVLNITQTESADSLCLDFRPEPGGTVGQVVMVRTQPFQVVVLAPDLKSFLASLLEGFKANRFQPSPNAYYCAWNDR